VTASSGLVHLPLTASSRPRGACAARLPAALACRPSVPELAAPASVVLHWPASACCQAVLAPSFSSAAKVVAADNRHTGRASAAAAAAVVGSQGRDPSGCQHSCSSAAVAASTSAVVGTPETTCRPADGTAAAARRTDQARTAAADCMAALGTHKNTRRNTTKLTIVSRCCKTLIFACPLLRKFRSLGTTKTDS